MAVCLTSDSGIVSIFGTCVNQDIHTHMFLGGGVISEKFYQSESESFIDDLVCMCTELSQHL